MAYSGHKIQHGVDTLANPVLVGNRVLNFDSVNRMYRGGINDTRLPFQLLNLVFQHESEREIFEKGSITGIEGYTAVPPYTRSHLVVTVSNCVFVAQVIGNTAYMVKLYDKLDPSFLYQFFVQGETLLVINDGKNEGIYWNGQTDRMYPISHSEWVKDDEGNAYPMPIGNIAIYAHGRFWILTEDGRLYAGDHLYGRGINTSDEVLLSFKESNYPESGDGFTATSSWGDARGLAVITRDPSTNGHGEIIVFHVNGAYSVTPLADRNLWTTEDIQQTVFSGIGGCSPWSIIPINTDLMFRGSDKRIYSLRQVLSQRAGSIILRAMGNEVIKYLSFDSNDTLKYSMAAIDDGRMFFTVNHQSCDNKELGGKHRFGNGLVVCDIHAGTASQEDSLSWDGLWTGPRVTGIATLISGTEKKCIFSSYDLDGINRLYTIRPFRGPDIRPQGPVEIVSMYSVGNLFDTIGTDSQNEPIQFKLKNALVFYSDSVGESKISSDYRSSFSKNWYSLYENQKMGYDPDDSVIFFDLTNGIQPSSSTCSVTEYSGNQSIVGVSFDMRVIIKGSVMIRSNILLADQTEISTSFSRRCPSVVVSKDDSYDLFSYQF